MQAIRRLFGDQAAKAIELPEWVGPSGGLASDILRGFDPSAPMTQSWFPALDGDVTKAIRVPSGDTDAGPAHSIPTVKAAALAGFSGGYEPVTKTALLPAPFWCTERVDRTHFDWR